MAEVINILLSKAKNNDDDASIEEKQEYEENGDLINSGNIDMTSKSETQLNSVSLDICTVSLNDAGMLLESGDIIQQPLDAASAIQLSEGTATFVQNFEAVDESDSGSTVAKFIDGQVVHLEDGSTAFIHASPREGLQAVQLEDGTMAYLSQTGADLFDGEASGLDFEQIASPQITDNEEKERDNKTGENFVSSTTTRATPKSFRCLYENCHRFYTTLHHLKVHERSHTGDRPFKCPVTECGKAFATGYGLKSHTRVHTGETPYKCVEESCRKAFKTSGDLQKHLRTHTGERPFKCPFNGCDRAFTTSNIRKVHIRTHTGERPYVCKESGCGRAFASATNYKNHIRIHTGEKPYVCTFSGCNKRFTEYSSLYKHNVVHTHSKPYTCNICSKTYRQTSTLAMHKRTVHGITESNEETVECSIAAEDIKLEADKGDKEVPEAKPKSHFSEQTNLVIKSANCQQESVETVTVTKACPTLVTLQGDHSSQILHEHPIYAVQVQDDGTLSGAMQQILLVTDPSQLAALQQLAQQGQFETILATRQCSASDSS